MGFFADFILGIKGKSFHFQFAKSIWRRNTANRISDWELSAAGYLF
jgi:hypothetical protein